MSRIGDRVSIDRVKRTIESVERVITRNLELAHLPGHEGTYASRGPLMSL